MADFDLIQQVVYAHTSEHGAGLYRTISVAMLAVKYVLTETLHSDGRDTKFIAHFIEKVHREEIERQFTYIFWNEVAECKANIYTLDNAYIVGNFLLVIDVLKDIENNKRDLNSDEILDVIKEKYDEMYAEVSLPTSIETPSVAISRMIVSICHRSFDSGFDVAYLLDNLSALLDCINLSGGTFPRNLTVFLAYLYTTLRVYNEPQHSLAKRVIQIIREHKIDRNEARLSRLFNDMKKWKKSFETEHPSFMLSASRKA